MAGVMQLVSGFVPQTHDARLTVVERFAMGDRPSISIDNWAGDIEVVASDDGDVTLEVVREGAGRTAVEALAAAQSGVLKIAREGNHLDLRVARAVDAPGGAVATIRATVPRGAALQLRTLRGDIRVSGADGHLTAVAAAGDIDVRLAGGLSFSYDVVAQRFRSAFPLEPEGDGASAGVIGKEPKVRIVLIAEGERGTVRLRKGS
jgi:hypothetical protein